jgi:hypothetical protein
LERGIRVPEWSVRSANSITSCERVARQPSTYYSHQTRYHGSERRAAQSPHSSHFLQSNKVSDTRDHLSSSAHTFRNFRPEPHNASKDSSSGKPHLILAGSFKCGNNHSAFDRNPGLVVRYAGPLKLLQSFLRTIDIPPVVRQLFLLQYGTLVPRNATSGLQNLHNNID